MGSRSFYLGNRIFRGRRKRTLHFLSESKIDGQCIINQPRKQEKVRGSNNFTYLVEERRIFEKSSPQFIAADDVASIICNYNVIFYTGAGLSVASGVPSMSQLNDLLGLKEQEEFIETCSKHILSQPEKFVEKSKPIS